MYVLDTNAVYYLTDPSWTTPERLARLQKRATEKDFDVAFSPITVLELASRIAEDPPWFARVQASVQALLSLAPSPLPDPEQRMREITEGIELPRQSYQHWQLLLETIARAPDSAALQHGYDDYTSLTRRSGNVAHIATYRAQYEQEYVRDMLELVRRFNPRYDDQVLRGKAAILPKSEQAALLEFFKSPEWNALFVATLAYRGGSGTVPTDAGKLAVVAHKCRYYQQAYEALTISMFCDGARPNLKRKNDYNDIHQLLYVDDFTQNILVSEDTGVISKVGSPLGKVISFGAFLNREAP